VKKNRKSERNLLVASLVLLIILLISAQASTNTVVYIADATIDPESSITLPLKADNIENYGSCTIKIKYNPAVVQVEDIMSSPGSSINAKNINNTIGLAIFSAWNIEGITGNISLANIICNACDAGRTPLNIDVDHLSDISYKNIDPLSINHGSIRINALQPPTPLIIHGYIFYENSSCCSNPVVNITNMNNGKTWTSKTIETSNYYRIMLASYTDVAALETLQINAVSPDKCQSVFVERAVTLAEVETGDSKYNITLESSINHEILSVGSAVVDVNDTIVIPVTIANATGIRQVSMDIAYDPESITITNISVNDCIPSSTLSYTLGTGIATIDLMNDNITVTNATTLIDITIQARENSTTTLLEPLNVEMTDGLGSHSPFSTVNGSVIICIKGDFNYNDRVDIGDAAKVAFMVAEKVEEDPRADFNNNGRVDVGDAAKISFYLAQKVSEL